MKAKNLFTPRKKSPYKMDPTSNRYRICPNDGEEFMADHRSKIYCSDKCADDFHNQKKKKIALLNLVEEPAKENLASELEEQSLKTELKENNMATTNQTTLLNTNNIIQLVETPVIEFKAAEKSTETDQKVELPLLPVKAIDQCKKNIEILDKFKIDTENGTFAHIDWLYQQGLTYPPIQERGNY